MKACAYKKPVADEFRLYKTIGFGVCDYPLQMSSDYKTIGFGVCDYPLQMSSD